MFCLERGSQYSVITGSLIILDCAPPASSNRLPSLFGAPAVPVAHAAGATDIAVANCVDIINAAVVHNLGCGWLGREWTRF